MQYDEKKYERYFRQIILDGIGKDGQEKLLKSKFLVIGAGGLGSPALMYLASAGTGILGIADFDSVSVSNLNRQIIHSEKNMGKSKVLSAKETLLKINSDLKIISHEEKVTEDIISDYDFVLDCTDNFSSKFFINDVCVRLNKPYVHAGINGFKGQVMTVIPEKGGDLRKLFPVPPSEENSPVPAVGAVCGVIGSIEAMEAIKYVLNIGELLTDCMLIFDALDMSFRKIRY